MGSLNTTHSRVNALHRTPIYVSLLIKDVEGHSVVLKMSNYSISANSFRNP